MEEIVPGVWIALSIGHSNAIFIEGNTSVILVDTLDTGKRGERLREIIQAATGKEVGTIIYTHSHVDHRGGAGAFDLSNPEAIAFSPCVPVLEHSGVVQDILNKRGARQFGFSLSDEENISQGIGIRTGAVYGEARGLPQAGRCLRPGSGDPGNRRRHRGDDADSGRDRRPDYGLAS